LEENLLSKGKKHCYRKPSERAAGVVLSIFAWLKCILGSTSSVIPRGWTSEHRGRELPPGKTLRYPSILLVEDNPHAAEDFLVAIKGYYVYGSVMIFIAHAYDAALTFFDEEDIGLVIMDSDLDDDDGDGADLIRRFLNLKPHLPILANSSSKLSNLKLTNLGAVGIIGKNCEKLAEWLRMHDPAGAGK